MTRMTILDHGYIELVETWGSDERIIEAARMSTGKGFKGWGAEETCDKCLGSGTNEPENGPGSLCKQCRGRKVFINKAGDEKLLRFLYENAHATPFEMAGLIIEVQAPIFIFREWHRHRTQSYNEMSARYTPLPDVNYKPTADRCLAVNGANKQANGHRRLLGELTHIEVIDWLRDLETAYTICESVYKKGLDIGIPKEIARLPVPVARYSRMRASTNLRNWLAFLTLRSDKNLGAQWEIRQFANALSGIVAEHFPRTHALFVEPRQS